MDMRSGWKRVAKSRLAKGLAVVVMLTAGAAVPSMAQERLEQDFGIICAGDVWRLCAGTKPGGGRIQDCIQDKMGSFPKLASVRSSTRWPARHSRFAGSGLCALHRGAV
jgi:hypothetical protein